jgi:NodT family efflux transporter outer membrane factor (OMF) lipoprotein
MIPRFDPLRAVLAVFVPLVALALAACAAGPFPRLGALTASADRPDRWQAPLPHGGESARLRGWWRQFDDPVLVELIDAAQAASPTIAAANTRIARSRASRVAAGGGLLPAIDGSAQAVRGNQGPVGGLGTGNSTTASAGLQASWELDLFGGRRAARAAAQARLEGAEAGWHDARVSVAAETAVAYTNLRACEAQVPPAEHDAQSRVETARLADTSTRAGFESSANLALARAGAAESRGLLTQRRARCDLLVKGLVAMTGLAEPALRDRLATGTGRLPTPASIDVARVPAQALGQRPDVAVAENELIAAGADISEARAARLPRVMLNGQIAGSRTESAGLGAERGSLWSFGPVSVTIPIFDAGVRRAHVGTAEARYTEADAVFRSTLRNAVREVEEALITLKSTADRDADAQAAIEGYDIALQAAQNRVKGGMASLFELEEARRLALQAQISRVELQRERVAAWISLYRALGGGWNEAAPVGAGS